MEKKKSYRAIYKEIMAEVHTPEEVRLAFEDSFAACFALAGDPVSGKWQLFGKIREINPEAIVAQVDLLVAHMEPVAKRKQYLVINKNGSMESCDLLGDHLVQSGIITDPWFVYSKKRGGIKGCYCYKLDSDKPMVLYKANLLIDGEDLLLSVRHLSDADRARRRAEQNT